MFRIIRSDALDLLRADAAGLETLRGELAAAEYGAGLAQDAAIRAELHAERMLHELVRAHAALIDCERERAEQLQGLAAVIRQVTAERDEARRALAEHSTGPDTGE